MKEVIKNDVSGTDAKESGVHSDTKTGVSDRTKSAGTRLAVVDIVKAVSCIMIFLYHCNTILPGEWKFLTLFGQDLGNNLFFMVSGFTLAPSIDVTPLNGFPHWYLRRLMRILPITVIAYAVTWFWGYFFFRDPAQLFAVYIYPTLYWFITAILVFYIILFLMAKLTGDKVRLTFLFILAVLFLMLGDRQERLYVIGLFAMIAGYMLREMMTEGHPITKDTPGHRTGTFAGLMACFVIFMAGELTSFPYVSKGMILIGAVGTGICALLYGSCTDEKLKAFFSHPYILRFVRYLGDMALPLYLVQCFCSGYIGYRIGLTIAFPLSFPVNFIIVWGAGTVLYIVEKATIQRTSSVPNCNTHAAMQNRL